MQKGKSALTYAAKEGHFEVAAQLLATHPDVSVDEAAAQMLRAMFVPVTPSAAVIDTIEGNALARRRNVCIAYILLRCVDMSD